AHQPALVDDGDFLVVALVLRPPRDVLDGAVGVVGGDGELLLAVARHHAMLRVDGDPRDYRIALLAEGHAGSDPAADEAILVGADLDALAAAVRHLAGRLGQQQTL